MSETRSRPRPTPGDPGASIRWVDQHLLHLAAKLGAGLFQQRGPRFSLKIQGGQIQFLDLLPTLRSHVFRITARTSAAPGTEPACFILLEDTPDGGFLQR